MAKYNCELLRKGKPVRLNAAGKAEQLGVSGRSTWKIGEVIPAPGHAVHPERYELEPAHPFGPISGMFLESVPEAS